MPIDTDGRDSQDDIERLLAEQRMILEAPQSEQFSKFRDYVFKSLSTVFAGLRNIRARLPFQPWLIKCLSGFGVVTFLGVVWGAATFTAQVKSTRECALEAKCTAQDAKAAAISNYEKLDARLRPTEQGVVKLNADMENLLQSRGVQPATREHRRRMARELGLPPDSTGADSTGP